MEVRGKETAIPIELLGSQWAFGIWSLEYIVLLWCLSSYLDVLRKGPARYILKFSVQS